MRSLLVAFPLLLVAPAPALAADVTGKVTLDGGSTKPTIVYVENIPGAKVSPRAERPRMVQKDTEFAPDVLIVVDEQIIDFPNADKFYHNVFSVAPGNEFDLGMYRSGVVKDAKMREPGEVDIYCNIHPNMQAKILVLQNEHYVAVQPNGTYTLSGVPAGQHTIVVWSPTHEPLKKTVDIKADGPAVRVDATLAKRKSSAHMNKHGEAYGRYK